MSTITSLWMGDLEPYMDENFIIQAFMDWGEEPINVKMIRNKMTGLPQGYCFVEFRDKDQAQRCMLRLNGKNIPRTTPQKRFKLNHASYGRDTTGAGGGGAPASSGGGYQAIEYSLFVGDLSEEVDDLMLYAAFKRYPSLKTAKVVIDYDGRTKGYGFVRFYEENDQQKALHEMQNVLVGRRPIRVSFAVPKKDSAKQVFRQGYAAAYGGGYGFDPSAQAYANTQSYYNSSSWQGQAPQQQSAYQSGSSAHQSSGSNVTVSTTPGYYNNYSGGSNFSNPGQQASSTSAAGDQQRQTTDLEMLEDPKLDVDIEAENAKYIEQSEDFYRALYECRWFGIDNAMAGSAASAVAAS